MITLGAGETADWLATGANEIGIGNEKEDEMPGVTGGIGIGLTTGATALSETNALYRDGIIKPLGTDAFAVFEPPAVEPVAPNATPFPLTVAESNPFG